MGIIRCQAGRHCDDPIDKGGFVCVVCGRAFCKSHTGPGCIELKCCENCQRQCVECEAVRPATEGLHVGEEFHCATCLGISVDELRELEAA